MIAHRDFGSLDRSWQLARIFSTRLCHIGTTCTAATDRFGRGTNPLACEQRDRGPCYGFVKASRGDEAKELAGISHSLEQMVFKERSNMPMSTTWVFLGLLAGREVALVLFNAASNDRASTFKMLFADAAKAMTGLIISIVLAFTLPWLGSLIGG